MNERQMPEGMGEFNENREARSKAERTILETLGVSPEQGLHDFPNQLQQAIKSLPQYERFQTTLREVSDEQLPYEVFKAIRKENDEPVTNPDIPTDGVLINSIRQGYIECAGRTYVASTYLQERGYPHTVVEAPSHSFLLLEQDSETLAYCDANHNLFFTFPKAALQGYEGAKVISECHFQEYKPRPQDFSDGLDMVYPHFITLPAKQGVASQYLGSVKAALAKLKEFEKTPIQKDTAAAEAMTYIQEELLGPEDPRITAYFENDAKMVGEREAESAKLFAAVNEMLQLSANSEEFSERFATLLNGPDGKLFPYLKGVSLDIIKNHAVGIWNQSKKQ